MNIIVSEKVFNEIVKMLAEPARDLPKLRKLLTEPSVLEDK